MLPLQQSVSSMDFLDRLPYPRSVPPPSQLEEDAKEQRLWSLGHVLLRHIDDAIQDNVTAVINALEQRTVLSFVKDIDAEGPALSIHTSLPSLRGGEPSAAQSSTLCCFEPQRRTTLRELAQALLGACGVRIPHGSSPGQDEEASILTRQEAALVNQAYAREVLPSVLPAAVEIGLLQLAEAFNSSDAQAWSSTFEGRQELIVSGAMRWSNSMKSWLDIPDLQGAIPTFTFRDNKAEVIVVGSESVERIDGPPAMASVRDLGSGIREATDYARSLHGRGYVGGMPTYLEDGSMLAFKSAHTGVVAFEGFGENLHDILDERRDDRAAYIMMRVSQWAAGRGALLGIPTFREPSTVHSTELVAAEPLEVLLLHSPRHVSASPRTLGYHPSFRGLDHDTVITSACGVLTIVCFIALLFMCRPWRRQQLMEGCHTAAAVPVKGLKR